MKCKMRSKRMNIR